MTNPSTTGVSWYRQTWVVVSALLFVYPLGVVLLWATQNGRAWAKAVATALFFPAFALEVLVALSPYWDFTGSMALGGFRLDLDRGASRDRLVERHRADQQVSSPATTPPWQNVAASAWPGFRGALRDGVSDTKDISLDWVKCPPREIYRQPVGAGYAGFAVGAGRAFTIEQRRDKEAVVCYDVLTGRELWVFDYVASFKEVLGGNGPRSTPTLAGDRLYVLGAEGHFHCLDPVTGTLHWAKNVLRDFGEANLHWGMAASPLVMDGKVIVGSSGKGGPGMLAFDALTGSLLWRSDAVVQCYSSPMDVTLAGKRQILNLADAAVNGIDPADGTILWTFPWEMVGGPSCAQPLVVGHNRVFVSSGYGKGAALLEIKPHAQLPAATGGGRYSVSQVWATTRMKNKFASSVLHLGFIYGLDEGVLACLNAETGERKWKGGKYGHGALLLCATSALPLTSRGDVEGPSGVPAVEHLLVLSEQGELALVKANPVTFSEVGRAQILHGRTWNNFAIVGGIVLARNHKEMAAYELRPAARAPS
jgi:outer membrane protein assembly factor BamB